MKINNVKKRYLTETERMMESISGKGKRFGEKYEVTPILSLRNIKRPNGEVYRD